MNSKFSFKTLIVSAIVGIIIVLSFSWLSGSRFDEAHYPVIALLAGFVVTGFVVGIISEGITILEPGLGSIIVAIVSYFAISTCKIKGFAEFTQCSDWVILMMNGIVLTFVGAWLGEKFQSDKPVSDNQKPILDVSWIIAGTVFGPVIGMALSMQAVSMTSASIAQTIFSLVPVFVLVLAHFFYHEKITLASFFGAKIAIMGVVILIWRKIIYATLIDCF